MRKVCFFSNCKDLFHAMLAMFFVSLSVLMVAGCAQSAGGSMSNADDGGRGASTRVLGLTVSDKVGGRTIYYDTSKLKDFDKLLLTGKSARGSKIELDVTSEMKASGEAQVELAATYWELRLTAYIGEDAVLEGRQNVDLTNGTQTVKFTLAAGNLTTPGTVNISGTFVTPSEYVGATQYSVGLYKLTGRGFEAVAGYEDVKDIDGAIANKYKFDKSDSMNCPPGTYYFVFRLLKADGKPCSEYSDLIIVNPGLCTEAKVDVSNYMNEPPAKPTDFVAEKIDSSASQTDVDAYYDVRFTWKDESDNETYFELVLKEYDAAGSEIAHQTFPISGTDDSELARLLGSDDSLIAGSETCTLRLPTGRLFDVTIQSKNAMGGLGEVSRSDGASSNPGYTAYASDVKINLVRRVYNLDGGKLSYKGEAYIGSYYDYNIYDGTDISLVEIDGTNDTLIKKVGSTEYIFEAWKDDSTHKVLASDFVPAGFKDGAYTAKYPTNIIKFEVADYKDITTTDIKVSAGDDIELSGDLPNFVAKAPKADDITVEVVNVEDFESYKFSIAGGLGNMERQVVSEGSANAWTFNTGDYESGNYNILVEAVRKKDRQSYSYSFNLKIAR